tara:strand:+ start:521 stop:3820 length:3300 start_codon:yes stop_codon:yes gene_type:complete
MKFKILNFQPKSFIIAFFFVMSFGVVQAQTITVQGVVTGGGDPLPGASVLVKGTTNGVVADFDGNYTIIVDSKSILVYSYIGFSSKEIQVKGRSTVNVDLSQDVAQLDEIVIIGYGTAKRKDLTGSVVSIKAEELNKVKPISFEGGIAGRAAGVQIVSSEGGPDAGFKVRVRGGTSINASSDPLYVIDGFALQGDQQSTGVGLGNSNTSPLAGIDPSTIESIEVLKDASATAIYGSRGANGVILITTKGGKKGRKVLNFEAFTTVSTLARKLDLLSGQEYVDWRNEYSPWDPSNTQDFLMTAYRDQYGNSINLNDSRIILTDWQDEISRVAITNNYKLSMSGGTDTNTYSASFSYLDAQGIIKTSDFERYNGSLRINQNISKKIKAGMNLNVGFTNTSGVVTSASENANGRSGIVTSATLFSPVQGITRYQDAEYDEDGRVISLRSGDVVNPNRVLEGNKNRRIRFNSFGNVFLQYQIAKGLTFKTSIRGNLSASKGQAYFSEKFGWGQSTGGRAFTNNANGMGITTEQNLSYNNSFGKHRINATAVYEQQESSFEQISSTSTGFDLPGVNLNNLGTAQETLVTQSFFSDNALRSILGRVQYDFDNRFTLNASARYDGSSRFAEGSKWGFFPSVGVAWKVSNEKFLSNNNVISYLKLKASYGETGNTAIGSYISLPKTETASYILNGNDLNIGVAVQNLVVDGLTWETTAQFDAGFSISLFKDRISLDADYYSKETTNLLLNKPIPATTGFDVAFTNVGTLVNKGYEFVLNTINIDRDDFTWKSSFNISFNENEVKDLGGAKEFFTRAIGDNQIPLDYVIRVGEPVGNVFGLQNDGLYQFADFVEFDGLSEADAAIKMRQDALTLGVPLYLLNYTLKDGVVVSSGRTDITTYRPGLPKLKDQLTVDTDNDGIPDSGDGIINSDDRTIIGRTVPKHFGGFNNNFTYKNFDLSILTTWSYGNDVYNKNRVRGIGQNIPFFNKYGEIRDRWTPENTNTTVPSILGYGDAGVSGNAYSEYVEDGSFLRLSNITLGYTLPRKVAKSIGVTSVRIYGAADNIYVWTNYTGYDPDVNVGNNQLTPGLDSDSYPRARTFRLGINVGF